MMRAVLAREPGGPDTLELVELPDPEPGPGEVVVTVAATAVNRADLLQREGKYPPPPGASDVLGLECVGTITRVGAGVDAGRTGQRVAALLAGGGYAEQVAVPVGQLMPLPAGLDWAQAAALPEVACTTWSDLVMEAHLAEGELLLIHGGGSGIGTFGIQLARALGARVAVTASAPKLADCERLGAEILIDYKADDFVAVIREATGGTGADVILDNMGAQYLGRNVETLARNGRLVVIGMQGGVKGELDLGSLLRRNGRVIATSLRGRPAGEKALICEQVATHVWPMIEAGLIAPVIGAVMPLGEVREAHRLLEAGAVTGKIVLTVS